MTKKIIAFLLVSVLLVALVAPTAMAKMTDEHQKAIEEIRLKIFEHKNELTDIYLDADLITPEEATLMKERHAQHLEWQRENLDEGRTFFKRGGHGRHGGRGYCGGLGMGHGGHGFNNF